jgi:hypothetical protein
MATDVKFGMVVGLGVVLAVAVTYYSKGPPGPTARVGSVLPTPPGAGTHAAGVKPHVVK